MPAPINHLQQQPQPTEPLFLDEGLDASSRILCATIADVDGTYPHDVLLAFQVDRFCLQIPQLFLT